MERLVLLVMLLGTTAPDAAPPAPRKMQVAFINQFPRPYDPWANLFVSFTRESADQLGIQLREYRVHRWPGESIEQVRSILNGPERPDYVLATASPTFGARLLQVAEEAKVPVFLVNAGLPERELALYGGPRERFRFWIGQMLPDDEQAGFELAHRLIGEARRRQMFAPDGLIHVAALSGVEVDWPSTQRERGLRRALRLNTDARLEQIVWVNWSAAEVTRKTPLLLRRYPESTVLWAAGDTLAQAAIRSLDSVGRTAGDDILVGGVDWEPDSLASVHAGEMLLSMGGHVLEGGWSMVLLYDYHHGKDFAEERVDWRTCMRAATRDDAAVFLELFRGSQSRRMQPDFRALAKAGRAAPGPYRFTVAETFGVQGTSPLSTCAKQ